MWKDVSITGENGKGAREWWEARGDGSLARFEWKHYYYDINLWLKDMSFRGVILPDLPSHMFPISPPSP